MYRCTSVYFKWRGKNKKRVVPFNTQELDADDSDNDGILSSASSVSLNNDFQQMRLDYQQSLEATEPAEVTFDFAFFFVLPS